MVVASQAAGRFLVPFAQQVTLSFVGTIVATFVIAAVQHGSPSAPGPELTSGGKFAARAEAPVDMGESEAVTLSAFPLLPPLRALPAPQPDEAAAGPIAVVDGLADRKPLPDLAKTSRHATRSDAKRRAFVEAAHDMVPPKRMDYIDADVTSISHPAEGTVIQAGDSTGFWSSTKSILSRTATYSNALLDYFVP